ncbi:MAG TPA: phosphate uptake regulator PhoU [Candidatus Korarchaeota archaeon]|nr:phosphate uptake regulator PhoU [Candidatus Korarchaeota archaeon]
MIERTVQKVGGASYVVTLPKEWVKKQGISKGSKVILADGIGGTLIIASAEPKEPMMARVAHSRNDTEATVRKIFAAYLEGYDVIEVSGEPIIRLRDRKEIKQFLSRFPGLEIIEEESNRMVLRCVLDPSMLEPQVLFGRMEKLVSSMLEDLLRAIREGNTELLSLVMDRDDEVDRVYFLLVRVVRKASQDIYLMKRLGVDPIQLIDLRVGAMLLEVVADRLTELSEIFSSLEFHVSMLEEMGDALIELYKISLESVIKRDVSLAVEAKKRAQDLLERLSERPLSSPEESAAIFALREVVARLGDLCDLVSP